MKNLAKSLILALIITLLQAAVSNAVPDSTVEEASALIRGFMADTHSPGVAITIGQKGKVI